MEYLITVSMLKIMLQVTYARDLFVPVQQCVDDDLFMTRSHYRLRLFLKSLLCLNLQVGELEAHTTMQSSFTGNLVLQILF